MVGSADAGYGNHALKLRVLAVGRRQPSWVEEAVAEYTKRMPKRSPIEVVSVRPAGHGNRDQVRTAEADRLLGLVNPADLVVALDETGKQWDTKALAERFTQWHADGMQVTFFIGGAEGLAQRARDRAQHIWGLSKLTLPHGLARVVVVEQLYRAWSLANSHPYHRG